MKRDLTDAVVVITGASSGIGRASARAFARSGARVVLASRDQATLERVAAEIDGTGMRALVVPTDVGDERAVLRLAERAFDRFGRVDVWINNAGVGAHGRIEHLPMADVRRLFETNVLGCIHGARAALPYFRRQNHGTLINVAASTPDVAKSYASIFAASKEAVRAFSASLRRELLLDTPRIEVCAVLPGPVDTPFHQHAANYTERVVPAPPRPSAPLPIAEAIVDLARHPKGEVTIGPVTPVARLRHALAALWSEPCAAHPVNDGRLASRGTAPHGSGNLFEPLPGAIEGGWRSPRRHGWLIAIGAAGFAAAMSRRAHTRHSR